MMSDLFDEYNYGVVDSKKKQRTSKSLSSGIIITPEMFIGWMILFIIGLILSFCLGVAQGRRLEKLAGGYVVENRNDATGRKRYVENEKFYPKSQVTEQKKDVTKKLNGGISQKTGSETSSYRIKKYAVQLVVYRDERYTKKEIDYLKERKIPFFIQNKNGKIIISAGPFGSRKEAENVSKRLKKRYRDCFVKLVRR